MSERDVALTVVKGGINRLRTKGAALNDSLYDLLNGYVTAAKTVKVRHGTFRTYTLPTDTAGENITKGLMAFDGTLHVFAIEDADVPAGVTLHIITHPTDATVGIEKIHFAKPFMGFPYVVAEFTDGVVQHYWLQSGAEWQPDTVYKAGDIVVPSTPNGLSYQASRSTPANTSWAPNVLREVGDVIEPTEYNDFYYTAIDTQGDNPRSGATEPEWPTEDGASIFEDADGSPDATATFTSPPDSTVTPNPTTQERYENIIRRVIE
jgi:hypothetical protein